MIRRHLHLTAKLLGWVLGAGTVVIAAALGLFTLRLIQGPIALDPFTDQVERALSDPQGRYVVRIDELVLALAEEEQANETGAGPHRLDLRARGVHVVNADGDELAAVPEMGVGFSIPALFLGKLSPTRLDLVRPRLQILRRADGSLAFDVRTATDPVSVPAEDSAPGFGDEILDSLRQAPDIGRPLGLLRRLSVTGADLTVVNRMIGVTWHASRADIALARDGTGTQGRARLAVDLTQSGATRSLTVEASGTYRIADGATDTALRFDGLEPAALASLAPALAPLQAVALPLGGTVEARLDRRLEPVRIGADLRGGAGTIALPKLRPEPYAVTGLSLKGSFDVASRRADLAAAEVSFVPQAGAGPMRLAASGTVTERDGGRSGSLTLSAGTGAHPATLDLTGSEAADGVVRIAGRIAGLVPASFSGLAPALSPLAAAALPLSGTAELSLDPSSPEGVRRPAGLRADLTAGPGHLLRSDLFDEPVPVASATVRLAGDRPSGRLEVERLAVTLGTPQQPGPQIEGRVAAHDRGGKLDAEATATVRALALDDLSRYWPHSVGEGARHWVTANIHQGTVTEATASVALTGRLDDLKSLETSRFTATIRGEDATVHYFRPLPPVTNAGVEAVTDGKIFTVNTKGGRIGDIQVGDGVTVIRGLDIGKETIDIQIPVQGPVRSILTLLDNPPLGYPSRLELDPKRTQGEAEAQLHFSFPLLADLKMEQLNLDVAGKLRNVGVEKVAAGLNATEGDLSLRLDLSSMDIKGRTKLDGIPVSVDWKEQFLSTARGPRTRIAVKGDIDAEDLRSHGIDLEDRVKGPHGTDLLFTIDQRHRFALTAALNLEKTRLSIKELGWEKPPGTPGTGKLTLEFDKDRPVRISGLTVEAAGLKGTANIELADGGKRVSRVVVSRLQQGQTDLRADVTVKPAGGGYAGTISGPSLDARNLMSKADKVEGPAPAGEEAKMTPLDLQLQLDRVVFGEGRQLTQVAGTIRRVPTAWNLLDVTARAGASPLLIRWRPDARGIWQALIQTDDAGAAYRALDLTDKVKGGKLRIAGHSVAPRPDGAIEGTLELTDYTLVDAPVLARILNAISPAGFAELMGGGQGIQFGRMVAGYRKEGRLLRLRDLRTSGSALGLTLEGDLDLVTDTANLRGTIVPIYGLNRLVGQIPLLGDLLSGGEGQGIFSATWRVQGPLGDPDVSVNPLAVLAPGFLRNLFFLGEGEGSTARPESARPSDPNLR